MQDCEEWIREIWERLVTGSRMFRVYQKLKWCKLECIKRRKQKSINASQELQQIQYKIEMLQKMKGSRDWAKWQQLKTQMHESYKQEEEFWSKKSRILWLKEWDRNPKYFHASTSESRKRNRIDEIQNDEGISCTEEGEIGEVIAHYFANLFTTAQLQDCDEIFERISRTITESMDRKLIRTVEDHEIKKALFSMHANKAPGPDGMPHSFFQNF